MYIDSPWPIIGWLAAESGQMMICRGKCVCAAVCSGYVALAFGHEGGWQSCCEALTAAKSPQEVRVLLWRQRASCLQA